MSATVTLPRAMVEDMIERICSEYCSSPKHEYCAEYCATLAAQPAERPSREALMELWRSTTLKEVEGNLPWSVEQGAAYEQAISRWREALARCEREAGEGGE